MHLHPIVQLKIISGPLNHILVYNEKKKKNIVTAIIYIFPTLWPLPWHTVQHTCGTQDLQLEPCQWEASTSLLIPPSIVP